MRLGYWRTPARLTSLPSGASSGSSSPVEHGAKVLLQFLGQGHVLAFDRFGHHRGGGHADGATLAAEADVLHGVAIEQQFDGHTVAA